MPPHPHHHHHHHGGGYAALPSFYPFYAGGWDATPSTNVFLVDEPNNAELQKKLLAYIASLPPKERAKAIQKFFGSQQAVSGIVPDVVGEFFYAHKTVILAAAAGFGALMLYKRMKKRSNPRRRRRRR